MCELQMLNSGALNTDSKLPLGFNVHRPTVAGLQCAPGAVESSAATSSSRKAAANAAFLYLDVSKSIRPELRRTIAAWRTGW